MASEQNRSIGTILQNGFVCITFLSIFILYYYIDKEIKAKLAPYAAMVHAAEKEIVGETSKTLHFEECVSGECALGDLLVDAMTEYVRFSNIIHTETNGNSMS